MLKTADVKMVLLVAAGVAVFGGLAYAGRNIDIVDKIRRGFDV